ncbi:Aldo-keto reductase YhdN [Streptomyces sp. RB17]|nr:Aldo-keto reductase YhdN [Streptomyces sp. RB17]
MGITFFDTADSYSAGTGEGIVARALGEMVRREDVVIATKVSFAVADGAARSDRPNRSGLSRKAIMTEIDHSLLRLGTDYIDLYQIHRFDPHTPGAGKARCIRASSMYA